jgi:hypothetical protein
MPSTYFLRRSASSLGGAGQLLLSQTRTAAAQTTAVTTTTAGGTNIPVTTTAGGQALTWFTEPITEAVTISGNVSVSISGLESATTVNAGSGILIERTNTAGVVQSTIVADSTIPATITEWTASTTTKTGTYTATSTTMAVGERIKVTLKVRNVGTMAAGTQTVNYDGAATTAQTWVTFTQDFRTDDPVENPPAFSRGGGMYG